jgi:hypothetical protein
MKNIVAAVVLTSIIVGGGGFYGGTLYAKSMTRNSGSASSQNFRNLSPEQRQGFLQQVGGSGVRQGSRAGGMVAGEVLKKDTTSITVKLRDGGSKIILFSDATEIEKMEKGSIAEIQAQQYVVIAGEQNSDGIISAKSIQVRPVKQ